MERRLFGLAVLTFFIELSLFLLDMGWIAIPGYGTQSLDNEQPAIGEVVAARQFVRRRGFDSNIWEDSLARERLFENDSILTLNGSSAKLKLRGDVNLELHENTLVVLEPIEEGSNEPFRLRFSRGDVRSRNGKTGLQLRSGEWTISAKPGTDLSVRAIDSHQVEVDVSAGGVDVVHRVSGQSAHIAPEQKLTLLPEEVGELVTASTQLSWLDPRPLRLYAHKFPIQVPLTWKGSADEMEITSPGRGHTRLPLPSDTDHTTVPLEVGSYHLTLRRKDQVSRAWPIEVLPAPKLVYLTPLPRDRVQTGQPLLYSWLSEVPLAGFRLEISRDREGLEVIHQASTSTAKTTTAIPISGGLHWKVVAFDEEGFIVPANHTYPIFSVPDPLAPPQLRAPSADDSAQIRSPPRRLPRGWALWSLLMSVAEGQSQPRKLPPVIFNWDKLPGADYYMIEISLSEDFQNPIIVAKSSTNFYAWSGFKKGIYFYRVAGGANSGRMGLFTPPTRVDLTIWPLPRPLPKHGVVTYAPPTPPPQISSPPETPQPQPIKTAESAKVAEPNQITGPPAPYEIFPAHTGRLWWRGVYRVEEFSGPDRVETSLSGPTATAGGLEFKSPTANLPLVLSADFAQFSWRPRSKTKLPFQEKFSTNEWNVMGLWSENFSRWHYGAVLTSRPTYQRQSLENISPTNQVGGGFVLRYKYRWLEGELIHQALLTLGSDFLDLRLSNRWSRPISNHLFWGAELNLGIGLRTVTGQTFETGVLLGISF